MHSVECHTTMKGAKNNLVFFFARWKFEGFVVYVNLESLLGFD